MSPSLLASSCGEKTTGKNNFELPSMEYSLKVYLLPGNEDGLINDDPSYCLLAAGYRNRTFVCHVEFVIRNQIMNRNGLDRYILTCRPQDGRKMMR